MAQRHADDLFFYCTLGIILGGIIFGVFTPTEAGVVAGQDGALDRRGATPARYR